MDFTVRQGYAFDDGYSSVELSDRLTPTDTATYPIASAAPSPQLSFDAPAAESITASNTLRGDQRVQVSITTCSQCESTFRGTYQSGNYARHVRQKHAGAGDRMYDCEAPNCFKVYQRKDARLKHMRKRHPELHLRPAQTRRPQNPLTQDHDPTHATSAPAHFSHIADLDPVGTPSTGGYCKVATPSISTLPSTLGYGLNHSQRPSSTPTYPSSSCGHYDPHYLAPYSLPYRRPTSLPPDFAEDSSPSHRSYPSRRSLQHDPDHCIDPAMLNPPGSDTEDDDGYMEGQCNFAY